MRCQLQLVPFAVGDLLTLNGKQIEVLSAVHTVPAVGFAVAGQPGPDGVPGWWVYTGDTGPNPLLWERLRRMKVAHLIDLLLRGVYENHKHFA